MVRTQTRGGRPEKEARDASLLSPTVRLKPLHLRCSSSSSVTGAVWSTDLWLMEGGAGAVGKLARSNQGNSSSLQHFWLRAAAGQGEGLKAGHSWISFLPSSFPLAFSYLSV